MAKLCFICGSLCAYILLFVRIASASSNNENFYQTGAPPHRSEISIHTELLPDNNLHRIRKRDTLIPNSNITYDANVSSSTTVYSKSKSGKLQKLSNPPKVVELTKNLGENGAGQRKNITQLITEVNAPQLVLNKTIVHQVPLNSTLPPLVVATNNITEDNQTLFDDDDKADNITKDFDTDDKHVNQTLTEHNITKSENDTHLYYNSTFKTDEVVGRRYWVDLSNISNAQTNELLSSSHRRAATVKLSFEFPFYGHLLKTVTIATGGFLYTGDYVHSWLAATQYIAPLMANFDTSLSNDSYIKYADNGTAFTVVWEKVNLQDKPNEGEFTFQTTLHKNGDIVFVYKSIPVVIENIHDDYHPVKVGLSDAYIMDRTVFFVRRKTIYEYHRVNFRKEDIKNWTVIYLKALPTCLDFKDCNSCLSKTLPNFKCNWCPNMGRCSNGYDRNRQDWLTRNCEKNKLNFTSQCAPIIPTPTTINDSEMSHDSGIYGYDHLSGTTKTISHQGIYSDKAMIRAKEPVKMGVSGIVAILFLITMVAGIGMWLLYAYRNPHTASGQILIRYRPSQWRWRRGEARYTAATIHM